MGLRKKQYDDFVWSLKYRPESVEDVILPKRFKTMFQKMVDEKNIGNILLNGQRGCGKTTAAYCLSDQTGLDTLCLNFSKETGIDTIRQKVSQFVSTMSFTDGKKIVIGDECDRLSPQAMDSLKSEIESFSKNCNFIFITNHKNRIIPELLSRLNEIDFVFDVNERKEMKSMFAKRICYILDNENVKYEKKAIAKLINMYFPDMRKTIDTLNLMAKQNEGVITLKSLKGNTLVTSDLTTFYKAIKNKDFDSIRKFISNLPIDHNTFYSSIFNSMDTFIKPESLPGAILTLAKYQHESKGAIDSQIPLSACCIELMVDCEWK